MSTADDDDTFLLCMTAMGSLGAITAAAATWWDKVVTWLVERQVLVAGHTEPLVTVPYTAGAGLDPPRVTIICAALLLAVAVAVSALRARRRAEELV